MTQEKKLILKYIWRSYPGETEMFEIIIGDSIDLGWRKVCDPYLINRDCHLNSSEKHNLKLSFKYGSGDNLIYFNIKNSVNSGGYGRSFAPFSNLLIPQLIEGHFYKFVHTGELALEDSKTFDGIYDGEMKEFQDLTEFFSVRRFFIEETKDLENEVNRWKSQANSDSSLISRNSSELTSVKNELRIVKVANLNLQDEITDKVRQINEKNELIRSGKRVLQTTLSQLSDSQEQVREKDNQIGRLELKLDEKQQKIDNLRGERESLKESLGSTGKEALGALERERDNKNNEVETLANQNGIELRQIRNLRRRYKDLILAEESNNRNSINEAEDNIEGIKDNIMETINIVETQKICKKCKKIAKLELKLDQIRQQQQQQQYQAHQEQPTNR